MKQMQFSQGDALIIVDPQVDFMPYGALGVPQGDEIIPLVNTWINVAKTMNIPVVVSRDWHPPHHISFTERGGKWPVHCVQNTTGAAFHPDLILPENVIIINKAFLVDQEAYSAFEGVTADDSQSSLANKLAELNIKRLWIAGLALEYCVYYTVLSARKFGFECHVILPACRAITEEGGQNAIQEMKTLGVQFWEDSVV